MNIALRSPLLLKLVCCAPSLVLLAGCPEKPKPPEEEPPDNTDCVVETNVPTQDATTAETILAGDGTAEGDLVEAVLCPFFDADGYRISVPNAGDVLLVHLFMETNLTPVQPSYIILRDTGGVEAEPTGIQAADTTRSAGEAVDFVGAHRIAEAGDYIVVVRDREGTETGFDNSNAYFLEIDIIADPDAAQEPNNTPETATSVTSGVAATGIIATSGDLDHYGIDVPGIGHIIDATITAPAESGVDLQATLFGTILTTDAGGNTAPSPALVEQVALLEGAVAGQLTARIRRPASDGLEAGRVGEPYYLVVSDAVTGDDDDDQDAQLDPALGTYQVTVTVLPDPDPNEGAFGNEAPDRPTTVTGNATFDAALATTADTDVYRVTPPGGTTAGNPQVLTVTVTFDAGFDAEVGPQVRAYELDPERTQFVACSAVAPCQSTDTRTRVCLPGGTDGQCGEVRLQRFVANSAFVTAYPVRTTNPIYIVVNEFNDDAFQETGGYTISFNLAADTDPSDDYLVPNLEEAGYTNGEDLEDQRQESIPRATTVAAGYPAPCAEGAPAVGCMDVVPVANAVMNGFDGFTVDCADADVPATVNLNLTGSLSFEGDRDFFFITGYPERGYFSVDLDINMPSSSIELATFVYASGGNELNASTLTVDQPTGDCREEQGGAANCPVGDICVDERCWIDTPNNPAVPNGSYSGDFGPQGSGDCITTGGPIDGPVVIEVVDNGLNDFAAGAQYQIGVTIRCGCHGACDTAQDFCQNGI